MVRCSRWLVVPALLGCLTASTPVMAQGARTEYVQDEALLFSQEAKAKANAEIAGMWRQFKKELVIDTVDTVKVPDIDDWAIKRAGREKVDGIFVVIVRDPRTVRVELGNHTKQNGQFSETDRVELRKQLVDNLKAVSDDPKNQAKKDHVLQAAVAFVHGHMHAATGQAVKNNTVPAAQHPVQNAQGGGTPWLTYILIGGAVLLVIWVVMGVLRSIGGGAGRPGMAGGGYGGGGGGGGFFSSLLGGMFGAAAGMWMYNNFFGGHSNSAWGAGPDGGSSGAGNDADTGYSGDGGDYGNDQGGGDAGGGDQGGSDAGGGGGDWGGGGGGGDFGGGGGGDWGGGGGGGGDW
jgi:hypothetical protein